MIRKLIALVALVFVLAACSSPPTSGTVEAKRYEASYTYYIPTCIAYTTISGIMSCSIYMPFPMTEPEHWQLQLHNQESDKTGWRDVDPTTYRQYQTGDDYPQETDHG